MDLAASNMSQLPEVGGAGKVEEREEEEEEDEEQQQHRQLEEEEEGEEEEEENVRVCQSIPNTPFCVYHHGDDFDENSIPSQRVQALVISRDDSFPTASPIRHPPLPPLSTTVPHPLQKVKDNKHHPWSRLFNIPLQRSRSTGCGQNSHSQDDVVPVKINHVPKLRLSRKATSAVEPHLFDVTQGSSVYDGEDDSHKTSSGSPNNPMMDRRHKRSIGHDMRERFAFFRRQGGEQMLTSKSPQTRDFERLIKEKRLTVEQINRWSTSFDELLADKEGLELFHEFLRTEFSEENIEFWMACEQYKLTAAAHSKKLNSRAHKIYNDYISVHAAREVNLDSATRVQTERDIQQATANTFEQAQKRIQALMEKDSYRRFLRSDTFLNIRKEVMQHSTSSTSPPSISPTTVSPLWHEAEDSLTPL